MKSEKTNNMPVSIICGFSTLEQKIIWEAVVLPEIQKVLEQYSSLLQVN